MSSSHIIIVARSTETGEVRLPLEDLTLYGCGGEEDVLQTCRMSYSEEWALTLYRPYGDTYCGGKK
ncbi:hypothetical protein LB533_20480 [Mesorhizobium sp. BR1-1-13]|uniref:hypothetical protein n=1 Tax=Mesorhizobium sp. BR1-1-13 TaxID=2876656 RepID=UPI001CD0DD93|nr:hypothetical protein [Mesorhizobium sp. BR1-1-13]MBZ9943466.1 hypothetical protein [Mesorhizobium sp. BR1-1-13]